MPQKPLDSEYECGRLVARQQPSWLPVLPDYRAHRGLLSSGLWNKCERTKRETIFFFNSADNTPNNKKNPADSICPQECCTDYPVEIERIQSITMPASITLKVIASPANTTNRKAASNPNSVPILTLASINKPPDTKHLKMPP